MKLFIYDQVRRITCPSPVSSKLGLPVRHSYRGGGVPINLSEQFRVRLSSEFERGKLSRESAFIVQDCGYLLPHVALTYQSIFLGGICTTDLGFSNYPLCHLSYCILLKINLVMTPFK